MKKICVIAISIMTLSLLANCNKSEPLLTLEECSWEKIKEISQTGKANDYFKIGDEKTVTVNSLPHKVRIIDFNKDVDKDGNNIGITFEFVNLISDSSGYSLATQWNDISNQSISNHNYLDSSVRMALVGEKQDKGHILWAHFNATTWSSDKSSVLDMLNKDNPDLLNAITAPKKSVMCFEKGVWVSKEIVNSNGDYDKLFLLSPEEMGNTTEQGDIYDYYLGDKDILKRRVKKQIKCDEIMTEYTYVKSDEQKFQYPVMSYAGYNEKDGGGYAWSRSPNTNNNDFAWLIGSNGSIGNNRVDSYARSLAPAFCI
ncbi:MAG: DUF6273 domain-containing protein [Bacilli bacterium]|nr:DUF6273 domain-containing protein [Bacilli bacterium]